MHTPRPLVNPVIDLPYELTRLIRLAAEEMAKQAPKAFQIEPRRRSRWGGATLRPGQETPLWNELRAQVRPHLQVYGQQVNLGRMLGLPRQRINAFVTGGGEMPDAERTLQLLAWLTAVRQANGPAEPRKPHVTYYVTYGSARKRRDVAVVSRHYQVQAVAAGLTRTPGNSLAGGGGTRAES